MNFPPSVVDQLERDNYIIFTISGKLYRMEKINKHYKNEIH